MRHATPLTLLLLVGLAAGPAEAGICTLVVLTPGTLAHSATGTRLGSEEAGGLPATMTVGSIGASTLTIGAPAIVQAPSGHPLGGDLVEIAYFGTGLLASANQPYTDGQTSVPVPNLTGVVAVTFNNRITNAGGFSSGTYQTRTVVTCS